jgi:CubicO group peptidase (beta-lactamase class C family)
MFVLPIIHAVAVAQGASEAAEAWLREAHGKMPYSLTPGISGAILSEGRVSTFGVGVQKAGFPSQADSNTLFEIGSLSKTMTALALATLVTSGKLNWDDPVRRWIGPNFKLGSEEYVSATLTVSDLLAHRTGLAEGQGDFLGYLYDVDAYVSRLANIHPAYATRSTFNYSNTGWNLAGMVLRNASGSTSWCEALHKVLLSPLNLSRTYCQRNEIPPEVASAHLAAVHKADPCHTATADPPPPSGLPALATYDFVTTSSEPSAFAWGAADAAGSVVSSVADMGRVVALLLGWSSSPILARSALDTMLTGQMVTSSAWAETCGVAGWGSEKDAEKGGSDRGGGISSGGGGGSDRGAVSHIAGRTAAAGYGFDLVMGLRLVGLDLPYAEKNGDTNMHKARLGLLPLEGSTPSSPKGAGVLLTSNLGGSMGGPLTALKFGVLAILAGGSARDAYVAAESALNTTGFWEEQWGPQTTCTPCGRSGASGPCMPSGHDAPPLPASAFVGNFGTVAYGSSSLSLTAGGGALPSAPSAPSTLQVSIGPVEHAPLSFSRTSFVVEATCAQVAATLEKGLLQVWAVGAAQRLAFLPGNCTLVEYVLPAEVPAAGVSASKGTVAFPWGCGPVPLPDGPSVYAVSHEGQGRLVSMMGEAFEAHGAWAASETTHGDRTPGRARASGHE